MNVLIVGSGGREHALAWKAARSAAVQKVYVAPGNAGTQLEQGVVNVDIQVDDSARLVAFAAQNAVDLTIIGPDAPVVAGIVDRFTTAGLRCFGPTAQAAQLEGSKVFAKTFMARHHIPTAAFAVFTDERAAVEHVHRMGIPIVIKADGLAAGKGVTVARDMASAEETIRAMLSGNAFGDAGKRIIIESCLVGEEVSFTVIVGQGQVRTLCTSQDHKARDDGDRGPNTGGMGAYSPAPVVTDALHERIMREVIWPTVHGMAAEGIPYTGVLYVGLMVGPDGTPQVLEYNCRLGDPETQPLLRRLRSDLVALCNATIDGTLDKVALEWDARPVVGVVMTARGYPGTYARGSTITGLDEAAALPDIKVFHAGTTMTPEGTVVTNGGRVLCVTALGETVTEAQYRAYGAMQRIQWWDPDGRGPYYRTDIGHRAIQREKDGGVVAFS